MAIKFIDDSILSDIADAIRSKLSVATTYKPSEMATAIGTISGGTTPTGTKQISITQNGTTTEDVTNYANAEITVNVSGGGSSGVNTVTGTAELSDTQTMQLTVPVDLTSATGFIINIYPIETGEVSGGVVTKYTDFTIPTEFSSKSMVTGYMITYPLNAQNPQGDRTPNNIKMYRKSGGNNTSAGQTLDLTPASSGVVVTTNNANQLFCITGAYVKYQYEITWW